MVQDVLAHQFEIYVSVFFHSALRYGTASGSDRMPALPQKTHFVFKTKSKFNSNRPLASGRYPDWSGFCK
jgi:hypothetical protein